MTNKEIAQKTKQYLMDRGWTNNWIDNKDKACIMIALESVLLKSGLTINEVDKHPIFNIVWNKMGVKDGFQAFIWNDSQTSVEAIYNLLDSIED